MKRDVLKREEIKTEAMGISCKKFCLRVIDLLSQMELQDISDVKNERRAQTDRIQVIKEPGRSVGRIH